MTRLSPSVTRFALIELVLLGIGGALGRLTDGGKTGWYDALNRSFLTPPDWVFGVVWTILYLMIGYVFWRLWERRARLGQATLIFSLFAVQMLLNWAWTPLFFVAHQLLLSFLWILVLVGVLLFLEKALWREERTSALFMIPYIVWCSFATYLAGTIWWLNNA